MKKKILALVVSFSMVFTMFPANADAATSSADGVAINETNFPDANFREIILDDSIDKDGDGNLSGEEAEQITTLNVSNKSITSMKGIEYFTKLSDLNFSLNANLNSLDLSKNTVLTKVNGSACSNLSLLTGLSASAATLTSLECSGCSLTTLDLTLNTNLTTVDICSNPWVALDVPENASDWKIDTVKTWITDLSWLTFADYGINADKITNLQGGTIRDGMLIPNNTYMYTVQYTYKCNASGKNIACKIKFNGREEAPSANPNTSTDTKTNTNTGTDTSTGTNTNTNTGTDANTGKTAEKSAKLTLAKVTSVKAKAGKKRVTISWKKVNGANGYKIYRTTKKNGKFKVVKTISKQKTVKFTNKKLAKGKTYYYKVRAYKKVNGKNIYGKYSKVVRAEVK